MKNITITMTEQDALELDLIICECGHRHNNHFEWGKRSCAHCDCKQYQPKARRGYLVQVQDDPELDRLRRERYLLRQ